MRAAGPVTAFAPGGVGNVGPGLDILGLAVAGAGDTVRAEWTEAPGIQIRDPGHPSLPSDPGRHTSALAARAVLDAAGERLAAGRGIALSVRKGLPLSGGQGGSAASAVAGAVAANALLGMPLEQAALLHACLVAEETVAGRHLDNIAASLLGGIVLVRCMHPPELVPLAVPDELVVVLVRPEQQMLTADGRAVLPRQLPLEVALHQAAQVGALVAALAANDYELLGRAIDDRIAEPARAGLLPGFAEAKAAALAAGALGSSISGSGPTAFALTRGHAAGERVAAAMVAAYAAAGQRSDARVAPVDRIGARLIEPAGGTR
ncbi:MAG TPA: homoserine kinase [Gemmatimonadales bacterium]|nr:homoserine kinase [Gemmatimonadales bacterium]